MSEAPTGGEKDAKSAAKARLAWIGVAVAVVGLVLTAVGIYASRQPSASADISISPDWPIGAACGGASSTAMPASIADEFVGDLSDRQALVDAGGGAYGFGELILSLTTVSPNAVQVTGIEAHIDKLDEDASLVLRTDAGCGEPTVRGLALNLDQGVMAEMPDSADYDFGAMAGRLDGRYPAPLSVNNADPAVVIVDVLGCEASYEFTIELTYTVTGETQTRKQSVGPFRVYRAAAGAQMIFPEGEGAVSTSADPPPPHPRCGSSS